MKAGHPGATAGIGEQGELLRFYLAHSRGVSRQVAHARHKISEREPPVAHAREPGVRLLYVIFGNPQVPAVAMDQSQAEGAPQRVAQRDAAQTAGQRRPVRQRQLQPAVKHQVAAERQQRFVRHGQPDDSQHQHAEDGGIPVLRDPDLDVFHRAAFRPKPSAS